MAEVQTCPHGMACGTQSSTTQSEIDSWPEDSTNILEFYSACDCCDTLMHKSTCFEGYIVTDDGRTLCNACQPEEAADAK